MSRAARLVDHRAKLLGAPSVRAAIALAAVVLATLGILETRLSALHHVVSTRRVTDDAIVPPAPTLRLLSLGHREWAADLLWTAGLVYFGETLASHQAQRHLQRYVDTIEELDPDFRQVYLWGATVSVYNARMIRREGIESAIRHLERGLQRFPDDGEMGYQLGFDYYFELPPLLEDAREKADARRRGAEYLRRAAALGYGPPWMALAAVEALQSAGLVDSAIEQLRGLLMRTDDPSARARIEREIVALEGERAANDPFLTEARRMETERQSAYPYVPPTLYLFVGPPAPEIAHVPPSLTPRALR